VTLCPLSTTALAIAATRCDVPMPHCPHFSSQREGCAAERCASSSAVALHRSPVAFLVDSDKAAAVGNQERHMQMLFFLDTLAEQSGERGVGTLSGEVLQKPGFPFIYEDGRLRTRRNARFCEQPTTETVIVVAIRSAAA
jgi:hypothetical protein